MSARAAQVFVTDELGQPMLCRSFYLVASFAEFGFDKLKAQSVVNLFLRRRGNEGRAAIEAAGPEIDAFVAGELLQGSR